LNNQALANCHSGLRVEIEMASASAVLTVPPGLGSLKVHVAEERVMDEVFNRARAGQSALDGTANVKF
jgi:hypothetical protein